MTGVLARAAIRGLPRRIAVGVALAVVALVGLALAGPEPAHALEWSWDPRDWGRAVVDAGKAMKDWPGEFAQLVLIWVLDVPDIGRPTTKLRSLRESVTAIAIAMSSLVLTAAVLRYWLAGLSEFGGAGAAFEGVLRWVGAVLMIVAWPWLFGGWLELVDAITASMVALDTVRDGAGILMTTAMGAALGLWFGGFPDLAQKILGTGALSLILGLVAMKVVMISILGVLYVAMPLLLILSVTPETQRLARTGMTIFAVVGLWPVIWIICFATFGAFEQDVFRFAAITDTDVNGTLRKGFDALIVAPLVAMTMLYVAVYLPARLTLIVVGRASGRGGAPSFVGGGWKETKYGRKISGEETERPERGYSPLRRTWRRLAPDALQGSEWGSIHEAASGFPRANGITGEALAHELEEEKLRRQAQQPSTAPQPRGRKRRGGAPATRGGGAPATGPGSPPARRPGTAAPKGAGSSPPARPAAPVRATRSQIVAARKEILQLQSLPSPPGVVDAAYGGLGSNEQKAVRQATANGPASRLNLAANRAAIAEVRGDANAKDRWLEIGAADQKTMLGSIRGAGHALPPPKTPQRAPRASGTPAPNPTAPSKAPAGAKPTTLGGGK
jgi:hypothetical protein